MGTVQFYIWTVFLPAYAHLAGGLPLADGLFGSTIALAIYCVTIPLFAALSDRIGRKPLLYVAAIGFLVLTWPMLSMLRNGDFTTYLVVDIVGILLISASNAVLSPVLSELFPARVRTSGIGLPYAICSAIFGGTAPLIAAALVGAKLDWALAAYIMAICLVAIVDLPDDAGDTRQGARLIPPCCASASTSAAPSPISPSGRAAATARWRR